MNWVLFDFADTLAELTPRRERLVAELVAKEVGIELGEGQVRRAYRYLDLWSPYSSVRIRRPEDRRTFYLEYNRHLLDALGLSHLLDPARLLTAFEAGETHWQLKAGAMDVLHSLKARGMEIGILSNFDTRLKEIVEDHLGLGGLVDRLHISQAVGLEKPDPRFYRAFFEAQGPDPARCVYIGDNYRLDFLPARAMGLETLLLDETGLYPHLPQAIAEITEVPKRVQG